MARRKRQIATNKSARADRQSGSGQADQGTNGKSGQASVGGRRISALSPLASRLSSRKATVPVSALALCRRDGGGGVPGLLAGLAGRGRRLHLGRRPPSAENPVLKPGGWLTTWVPGSYVNYWPLTFTAYWLEYALWGLNPLGFHLVNIARARRLGACWCGDPRPAAGAGGVFAAALFALHPVNVESVAWIAQLKSTCRCC